MMGELVRREFKPVEELLRHIITKEDFQIARLVGHASPPETRFANDNVADIKNRLETKECAKKLIGHLEREEDLEIVSHFLKRYEESLRTNRDRLIN